MKKKIWIFVSIILAVCLVVESLFIFLLLYSPEREAKEVSLQEYVDMAEENNYIPEAGYIPDAETAAWVGISILDALTVNAGNDHYSEHKTTHGLSVRYDSSLRLWKVSNGIATVVIEQDTGKVIRALFQKN